MKDKSDQLKVSCKGKSNSSDLGFALAEVHKDAIHNTLPAPS